MNLSKLTRTKLAVALSATSFLGLAAVIAQNTSDFTSEVRISREDGLATAIFHTPNGGKVSAFFPLNMSNEEAEIGGTVERQPGKPPADANPNTVAEAESEIEGVVTIEQKKKEPNKPPISCPPSNPNFQCPPPEDRTFICTYTPPTGPPCTTTVCCPPVPAAPVKDTCSIPQLTSCGGNMHVSMNCPKGGNPADNTCLVGGQAAECRAWCKEGCVFHVPPSSELPPGPQSVIVSRANRMAQGKTYAAQIKMTCSPNHLKPGQPCQVTTTVYCPGLGDIKDGILTIKNYNPAVLNMPDQVVPIPHKPSAKPPSAQELLNRDGAQTLKRLQERMANSPFGSTPQGQETIQNLIRIQRALNP